MLQILFNITVSYFLELISIYESLYATYAAAMLFAAALTTTATPLVIFSTQITANYSGHSNRYNGGFGYPTFNPEHSVTNGVSSVSHNSSQAQRPSDLFNLQVIP